MNTRLQASIAMALIGLSAVALTPKAAACSWDDLQSSAGRHSSLPVYLPNRNLPRTAQRATKLYPNPLRLLAPIAGLYQFTFTAQGNPGGPPDGTVLDRGFVTWHADGTEIMNSGRPPPTQSFCMGAWERTGPRSYTLNHYALSWDPTGTVFVGPTNIRETVQLDFSGNSYSGVFSIDQYAPNGTTVLHHVQGGVSATRLTADSN